MKQFLKEAAVALLIGAAFTGFVLYGILNDCRYEEVCR